MDIRMLVKKIANDPRQAKKVNRDGTVARAPGMAPLLGVDYRRALELIGMYS
jgi:hypothetical protein